ncbi:MAG: hypothetical protein M3498_00130 [Deinococcota bacterium]|jgi:hypothetical protein|nr:hypothetical protein [Deinococcota bacterium]
MTLHELQVDGTSQRDLGVAIEEAARALGLVTTQVTTLAKYPGSVHWHFKRGRERGTLEATYWPEQNRAWLSYRSGREANWMTPTVQQFGRLVEAAVGRI